MSERPGQLEIRDASGAVTGYATTVKAPGLSVVNGVADLTGLVASASGLVTLSGGSATVSAPAVTSSSIVFPVSQSVGVTGQLSAIKTPGVGFTIYTTNPADAGEIGWFIL